MDKCKSEFVCVRVCCSQCIYCYRAPTCMLHICWFSLTQAHTHIYKHIWSTDWRSFFICDSFCYLQLFRLFQFNIVFIAQINVLKKCTCLFSIHRKSIDAFVVVSGRVCVRFSSVNKNVFPLLVFFTAYQHAYRAFASALCTLFYYTDV